MKKGALKGLSLLLLLLLAVAFTGCGEADGKKEVAENNFLFHIIYRFVYIILIKLNRFFCKVKTIILFYIKQFLRVRKLRCIVSAVMIISKIPRHTIAVI